MSVEDRIRKLIEGGDGRAPCDLVVKEALGVAGATGPLARRLAEAAVKGIPGLEVEGDAVVVRARPTGARLVALALAPARSATALPAAAAWVNAATPDAPPELVPLAAGDWRAGAVRLAEDLAGADVLALSAASARRVLRLGASLAGLDTAAEPEVIALGQVARSLGHPLRSPEDAARLVGAPVPETPEGAALLLLRLAETLAAMAHLPVARLREIGDLEAVEEFDFGERAFDRGNLLALPEAPGVYVFEDAEGEVLYVGKAQSVRRRVGSYFKAKADERTTRIREAAHDLTHERTGSELTALLREQELIRELHPTLNVQEKVHDRARSSVAHVGTGGCVAVIQPSADGGAEVVLLDRARGIGIAAVVPDAPDEEALDAIRRALSQLRSRAADADGAADVAVALTWLADRGSSASVVEVEGDPEVAARLVLRVARDPDLEKGKVVPVV